MRRTIPLLVAVALALTGCTAESPEDAYVAAVTSAAPQILDRGTEQELVELGGNVCDYMDDGLTAAEATSRLVELGIPAKESKAVVTEAVATLC